MTGFPEICAKRYADANADALRWMLDRPRRRGFLDTCFNALERRDYTHVDGYRGPQYLHGWIQGRGLEALAEHGQALEREDAALSARCRDAAHQLHDALAALRDPAGRVFFRYDAALLPLLCMPDEPVRRQRAEPGIHTYSDAFAAKGLVAAARWLGDPRLPDWQAYLSDVISAVEDRRFQIDEFAPISAKTVAAQPDDYGPRMILLGAAHLAADPDYADRFIDHVLSRHFDAPTGLLRDVPGEDACNPGHAIEFVGFALAHLPPDTDAGLVATLGRILSASFRAGFSGPGLALRISIGTGRALSPYRPWWSLPETVRAAALLWERTRSDAALAIWKAADHAFFRHYWLGDPPVAIQTRNMQGPVDYVPATPDLDPGYHTGLSLLAAQRVAASTSERGHDGRS
jgi:hypothetical protein